MVVDQERALVVGVDPGTLSGPALMVRVFDGAELGSAVRRSPRTRSCTTASAAGRTP
jgi:ribulose kinase